MDTPQQSPDGVEVGSGTGAVPDVKPLDVTGVRTVSVGTVIFLVASLVLLVLRDELQDAGREWWLWTCVVGFGLGLFGYTYCSRRARHHENG